MGSSIEKLFISHQAAPDAAGRHTAFRAIFKAVSDDSAIAGLSEEAVAGVDAACAVAITGDGSELPFEGEDTWSALYLTEKLVEAGRAAKLSSIDQVVALLHHPFRRVRENYKRYMQAMEVIYKCPPDFLPADTIESLVHCLVPWLTITDMDERACWVLSHIAPDNPIAIAKMIDACEDTSNGQTLSLLGFWLGKMNLSFPRDEEAYAVLEELCVSTRNGSRDKPKASDPFTATFEKGRARPGADKASVPALDMVVETGARAGETVSAHLSSKSIDDVMEVFRWANQVPASDDPGDHMRMVRLRAYLGGGWQPSLKSDGRELSDTPNQPYTGPLVEPALARLPIGGTKVNSYNGDFQPRPGRIDDLPGFGAFLPGLGSNYKVHKTSLNKLVKTANADDAAMRRALVAGMLTARTYRGEQVPLRCLEVTVNSRKLKQLEPLIMDRLEYDRTTGRLVSRPSGLGGLESLMFTGSNDAVADLKVIGHFTGLQILAFAGKKVRDLSPLANLTELAYLCLDCVKVSDLSPLASLQKLRVLLLEKDYTSAIGKLNPLAELPNLEILRLSSPKIRKLDPLGDCTNLRHLQLSATKHVKSIAPLAKLTRLKTLRLKLGPAVDLSPLGALADLEELYLNVNEAPADGLAFLSSLPKLRCLHLENFHHADLSPLEGLTELRELDFEHLDSSGPQRLIDGPLGSLTGLEQLSFPGVSYAAEARSNGKLYSSWGEPMADDAALYEGLQKLSLKRFKGPAAAVSVLAEGDTSSSSNQTLAWRPKKAE